MRLHSLVIAIVAFCVTQGVPAQAESAALTGSVSSAAEPAMEGVLVSARKDGSTITVTVVSDDAPYDVVFTRQDEVWTGSMLNDQVARLDTKTGRFVEYLLPRTTNIRRVFVVDSGPRPVFWAGSNHGASIVKVEPLD